MPAPRIASLLALILLTPSCLDTATSWPQGAGPNGNWTVDGPPPPLHFSAESGLNIAWRTPMPETGQGGIAISGGRLFVATMAKWTGQGLSEADAKKYSHAIENRKVVGKHIDAHCLDQSTGEILWTRRIEGEVPSIYSYPFSDATSSSPIASDTHAWFTNSGGTLCCYTHAGELVWQRQWTPTFDGPFNKQFEPFLIAAPERGANARTLVHMEPSTDNDEQKGWHHLVGLDAMTGAVLWRSSDALTQYNTPILVETPDGPCVLHARGGPHAVPERPVGLTLTLATGANAGSTVWRYEDPRGNHEGSLQTMACDDHYVYWLLCRPHNLLVVIDRNTGKEVREISLVNQVLISEWDETALGRPVLKDLEQGVFPARYSMMPANGRLYFQCYATAWGKPVLGAPYCFACIDPRANDEQAAVRYLEVPTSAQRNENSVAFTWRTQQQACAINSSGMEVTGDSRSRWDGWDWVFNGTPTRINNRIYFTLASGLVYVLDADCEGFGENAFLALNDLGAIGTTWSANSLSYSDARIYHRTAAELICVSNPE